MAEAQLTITSDTDGVLIVVTEAELIEYDGDIKVGNRDNAEKVNEAKRKLLACMARVGMTEGSVLEEPAAATPARQDQLRDLAAAAWLEAIYREKAVVLTDDEGFAGKRQYWADQFDMWKDLVLSDPPQVNTAPAPETPRGALRFVPTRA